MTELAPGAPAPTPASARRRWEEPCILLERPLEASAQAGPPRGAAAGDMFGFLGPLNASGTYGDCVVIVGP